MNAPSSTASLAPDSATQRDPRHQLDPGLAVLDDAVEQARFTHYSSLADGQRVAESTLRITGMHCAACAGIIEQAVGRVACVLSVRVSASGERASIRWDPAQARVASMVLAVRRAGYDAMPDAAQHTRLARLSAQRSALWRLFVAAFCAMQVMMLATKVTATPRQTGTSMPMQPARRLPQAERKNGPHENAITGRLSNQLPQLSN